MTQDLYQTGFPHISATTSARSISAPPQTGPLPIIPKSEAPITAPLTTAPPHHCKERSDAAIQSCTKAAIKRSVAPASPHHCKERSDAAIQVCTKAATTRSAATASPRHCEERSDAAIQACTRRAPTKSSDTTPPRHCEERSDAAIQSQARCCIIAPSIMRSAGITAQVGAIPIIIKSKAAIARSSDATPPRHCKERSDAAIQAHTKAAPTRSAAPTSPRHCEEHSDAAIQVQSKAAPTRSAASASPRHCEERSDAAIQSQAKAAIARNNAATLVTGGAPVITRNKAQAKAATTRDETPPVIIIASRQAKQSSAVYGPGLPRRSAPRNDEGGKGSVRANSDSIAQVYCIAALAAEGIPATIRNEAQTKAIIIRHKAAITPSAASASPRHCEKRSDAAIQVCTQAAPTRSAAPASPRHCEERSDAAIQAQARAAIAKSSDATLPRHCEERSDAAIQVCTKAATTRSAAPASPRHCEERSDAAIQAHTRAAIARNNATTLITGGAPVITRNEAQAKAATTRDEAPPVIIIASRQAKQSSIVYAPGLPRRDAPRKNEGGKGSVRANSDSVAQVHCIATLAAGGIPATTRDEASPLPIIIRHKAAIAKSSDAASPRHCEERSDAAIQSQARAAITATLTAAPPRHCEERSDAAIQACIRRCIVVPSIVRRAGIVAQTGAIPAFMRSVATQQCRCVCSPSLRAVG
jgi:hypothetical protein